MNEPIKILDKIAQRLESMLATQLNNCGLMFRLFSRVKTARSLNHKMRIKGEKYRSGKVVVKPTDTFDLYDMGEIKED